MKPDINYSHFTLQYIYGTLETFDSGDKDGKTKSSNGRLETSKGRVEDRAEGAWLTLSERCSVDVGSDKSRKDSEEGGSGEHCEL